jgi:hypothetical protein
MGCSIMRLFWLFAVALAVCGCTSPLPRVSEDQTRNYQWIFPEMQEPRPEVLNSRVERVDRKLFGVISLGERNGDWEFELLATKSWLEEVRKGFRKIRWEEIPPRLVPSWFDPSPERYTPWQLQRTSYPAAHLFIERSPGDGSRIHLFIRRH